MRPRFAICVLSFACPLLTACKGSPGSSEPRALLQRAIEAHGGEENIKKPRKGILKGTSDETPGVIQEEYFDLPTRWKRFTGGVINDKRRASFLLMVDGKFWEWEQGGEVKETKNEGGATPHFATLTTLLELRDAKLSPIKGTTSVRGKAAVGFRAETGQNVGEFYFAQDTGLLAQLTFKWQSEPAKEFETKALVSDFREVDGVKLPYRRTYYIKGGNFKDYTLLADFQVKEVKIVEKLPDNTFALP